MDKWRPEESPVRVFHLDGGLMAEDLVHVAPRPAEGQFSLAFNTTCQPQTFPTTTEKTIDSVSGEIYHKDVRKTLNILKRYNELKPSAPFVVGCVSPPTPF